MLCPRIREHSFDHEFWGTAKLLVEPLIDRVLGIVGRDDWREVGGVSTEQMSLQPITCSLTMMYTVYTGSQWQSVR